MKKIKILVLSHMYPRITDTLSGIFIHHQMKHLTKVDCQVKVISPVPWAPPITWVNLKRKGYGQTPLFGSIEGISVYYPRYIRPPGQWFHGKEPYTIYYGINKTIKSVIEEFQPHILHTHTATPDGYVGLMLQKKYGIPLICSFRGSDINIYPNYNFLTLKLTKGVISKVDRLISVSQALKSVAESLATPKNEIRVIHTGCDLKTFTYNEEARFHIREKLKISPKSKVIIFVGRISKAKGIYELTEAFIRLSAKSSSDLHLIIVGNGPECKFVEEKALDGKLQDKVHLLGKRPHSEIPDLLSASDIFVLPSHYEGLPNVVVEAMACGKPVVATQVGGIPEVVQDKKTGILVPKNDVDSLTEAIYNIINDKTQGAKMGIYGRKVIEQNFSWKQSAEKIREVYEKLIR